MNISMRNGYAKCEVKDCPKGTAHFSGFCGDHRPKVKCAKHSCQEYFVPRAMKSRFCRLHKKAAYVKRVEPGWEAV